jgi:tetratricopeptide (TPR) repeat protein
MNEAEPLTIERFAAPTVIPAAVADRARSAGIWLLAVVLIVYLALSGGGYDIVVRSELGLLIWWLIVLGALTGLLPRSEIDRVGWIAAGLLAGFLVWSWIGLSWTGSHELTLDSVCQVSTYLGTLLIGLCLVTRETARSLLCGVAFGIAVVSGIAILSKLMPSLFPGSTSTAFYATARLRYPFDYADGVGEFAAIGIPLLLYAATGCRTLAARSLAAAGLPLVLLCLAMTVSRGGMLAAALGFVAFFALMPDRIPRLATLGIAAVGIALLMVALLHRAALRDQIAVAPAGERHSMLTFVIVVVIASAIAQAGVVWAGTRMTRPRWLEVSRRGAARISSGIGVAVLVVVVVAFASGAVSHMWHDFKQLNPSVHSNQYFRLLSLAGSHRYQYWQVALKAFESAPLIGIGPGMFRFYWAQHQTIGEYVLNAHSLWFETLAETGIVGALLLIGFFGYLVIGGAVRVLRCADTNARATMAASVAGVAAFCGAASFDWDWQIGVVPMIAMLMAAVSVSSLREPSQPGARRPQARSRVRARVILGLAALPAIVVIAIPLASTIAVRASQAAYRRGQLGTALTDANTAAKIEPSAATPRQQQALILEQLDQIGAARGAIAAAIARAPASSALWAAASRIALEADQPEQALRDYRRAKQLDPTNTLFGG